MTIMYDQNVNYQEFKLKLVRELKELEDKVLEGKSDFYSNLKNELIEELDYVNQIINQYYYR